MDWSTPGRIVLCSIPPSQTLAAAHTASNDVGMNKLWHTDLHEIQFTEDATGGASTIDRIAFLEDASHFIMHHHLIRDKRSNTWAAVLADAYVS
jgi:hypothetical protein